MHKAVWGSLFSSDDPIQKVVAIRASDAQPAEPEPARRKVLVVDDQKIIADTVSEILEGAGFHVMAAYDGWTALEAVHRFHPDYVLSDVLMPRMNGVELAISIRKMLPTIKVLLFSGQAGVSEALLEGKRQGFEFELIPKPIHPLKLIERLKER